MNSSKPFTLQEFRLMYSKIPRLTAGVVIQNEKGVLLTLRSIQPWQGLWHIPGGTVFLKESLEEAVHRVAKEELGVSINIKKFLGYIEYVSQEKGFEHIINLVFLCSSEGNTFSLNDEAAEVNFFTTLPNNIVKEEKEFLEKL